MGFRPSEAKLRYGRQPEIYLPATSIASYPGAAGFDAIALAASHGRVDRAGTVGGQRVEPRSLPGPVTLEGTFTKPFQPGAFDLGVLGSLWGGAAAAVQQGADDVWLQRFDALQTAVDLSAPATFEFDKSGGPIERWWPTRVRRVEWSFEKGAPVATEVTLLSLQNGPFANGSIDAGSPTVSPALFGTFSQANAELADNVVNMQVTAVAAGPPISLTVKFALGATPSFGSVEQTLVVGLTDDGFPRRIEPVDSTSGLKYGDSRSLWVWAPSGTGWAALDQFSWASSVAAWTPVAATQPELTVLDVCVFVDDQELAGVETVTLAAENDTEVIEPGFCGPWSLGFAQSGNVVAEVSIENRWVSDRLQKAIRHGAEVSVKVEAVSAVIADGAVPFSATWTVPTALITDGAETKAIESAEDSNETIELRGAPATSLGGANMRVDVMTDVETL